jgi:Tfp pilus assembly protein PilO
MRPRRFEPAIDGGGVLAVIALTAAFYFVGAAPILRAREAERSGAARLADLDREATVTRGELAEVRERLSDARRRAASSPLSLERPDRMNARMAQLNALAKLNGLEVDEIKPGSQEDSPWFTRVPLRIAGNGPYRAGMLFLHHLNRQFPDIGMTALEIRGDPATDDTPAIFMFDLVWYAAPQATADAGK